MRILHVNQQDTNGGAAAIAACLVEKLNSSGIESELWFFNKKGKNLKHVRCIYPALEIIRNNPFWNKILEKIVYLHYSYQGDVWNPFFTGVVKRILKWQPDVIHLHNLHGGWVDLKSIAQISKQVPIVITLHDEWLMTGHCAFTLDSLGWKDSCVSCPDLTRYVSLKRPITKILREEKLRLLSSIAKNNAVLAAPSEWLKQQFIMSRMWKGEDIRVIPNGINTSMFYSGEVDKFTLRNELGLPQGEKIAFFIADGGTNNFWKGFSVLRRAIELLPKDKKCMLIVAGDQEKNMGIENINGVVLKKVGYLSKEALRKYHGAVDVLVYPTKADSFGLVILEAMAAGLPVITTKVGAIPELVEDKNTGILVPNERADLLMQVILNFIEDKYDFNQISLRARDRAFSLYSSELMFSRYLKLYNELVKKAD
jgi:glycosyltransferase involved in cell wall biosynthesis